MLTARVSHLCPTGASLYFTFLARRQLGAELLQWQAAKQAASEAISARVGPTGIMNPGKLIP